MQRSSLCRCMCLCVPVTFYLSGFNFHSYMGFIVLFSIILAFFPFLLVKRHYSELNMSAFVFTGLQKVNMITQKSENIS